MKLPKHRNMSGRLIRPYVKNLTVIEYQYGILSAESAGTVKVLIFMECVVTS